MNYKTYRLSNGIRLIHRNSNSQVAHCGIIINTGSRDELEHEWGMAHFIEHVIFKGTEKRRAYHILNRMEDVGGELNAYTGKEETCIYSTFLSKDYERAIELMSDICFNSIFPEKELEKEKEVVIDEINSYKDSPSELIFDDFEELIFKNHPFGRNILGTEEILKSYTKNNITDFISNNYHTDQIVISSVGNIDIKKITRYIDKYFSHIKPNLRNKKRVKPSEYQPEILKIEKGTYQSHTILGNTAYDVNDSKRIPLSLLTNIIGGPGMNSKLNMSLREKYGYAYNVEANYTAFSDTGLFNIYFGCDKDNLDRCIELCFKEMNKLKTKLLTDRQLNKAKNQILGQLVIASENKENLMLGDGKSYLLYNKLDSYEETHKKLFDISSKQLRDIANEIFDEDKISRLIYY